MRSEAGLLTRGSLSRRLPDPRASDVVAGEQLPSQRRDRPGLAPGSLTALRMCRASLSSSPVERRPIIAWLAGGRLGGASSSRSRPTPNLGDGSRRLGSRAPQAGARGRVRDPRDAVVRATRRARSRSSCAVLYAVEDEIHQTFVEGRHGSPLDVLIDTAGATIGLAAHRAIGRRSKRRRTGAATSFAIDLDALGEQSPAVERLDRRCRLRCPPALDPATLGDDRAAAAAALDAAGGGQLARAARALRRGSRVPSISARPPRSARRSVAWPRSRPVGVHTDAPARARLGRPRSPRRRPTGDARRDRRLPRSTLLLAQLGEGAERISRPGRAARRGGGPRRLVAFPSWRHLELGDRRFDALLERLDRIADRLERIDGRLAAHEGLDRLTQRGSGAERLAQRARLRGARAEPAGSPPPQD